MKELLPIFDEASQKRVHGKRESIRWSDFNKSKSFIAFWEMKYTLGWNEQDANKNQVDLVKDFFSVYFQ